MAKNSGGKGAYAKIEAARDLGLPVVMVSRPHLPDRPETHQPEAVLDWLGQPLTERGYRPAQPLYETRSGLAGADQNNGLHIGHIWLCFSQRDNHDAFIRGGDRSCKNNRPVPSP